MLITRTEDLGVEPRDSQLEGGASGFLHDLGGKTSSGQVNNPGAVLGESLETTQFQSL